MNAAGYIIAGIITTILASVLSHLFNRFAEKRKERKDAKSGILKDKREDFKTLIEGFQVAFARDNASFRQEVTRKNVELERELKETQRKYEHVSKQYEEVSAQLTQLSDELQKTQGERDELKERVISLEKERRGLHAEVAKLRSQLNAMKKSSARGK